MKYRIRKSQFCTLSKEQKWQSWLQSVSQDLYDDLMNHLKISSSCGSNQAKMIDIQKGLEKRGLMNQMVSFLKKEYPTVIEQIIETNQKIQNKSHNIITKSVGTDVFQYYNPSLLTFPQKMIIENENIDELQSEVNEFCMDKIGCDYIIIGNKAFIEYFKRKYQKEYKEISIKQREIYKYRMKNGLDNNIKVVANI